MTRRPEPQIGIVPEPAPAAHFLVLRVGDHGRDARAVGRELSAIPALVAELDPGARPAQLACNVGIGPALWDALSPG
jgi:deferrochelatase/peroxidase EfeB